MQSSMKGWAVRSQTLRLNLDSHPGPDPGSSSIYKVYATIHVS